MREIKFRGYNKKTGRMVDCYKMTPLVFSKEMLDSDVTGVFVPFHPDVEIMQYTGLKDEAGKDIYEGDILLHFSKRYVVKWDETMAAFQTENISDSIDADFFNWGNTPSLRTKEVKPMGFGYDDPNCAIIGNIHQNPELLEAK
jgi:uncharacterized phage protein (TIGR01671 family)